MKVGEGEGEGDGGCHTEHRAQSQPAGPADQIQTLTIFVALVSWLTGVGKRNGDK